MAGKRKQRAGGILPRLSVPCHESGPTRAGFEWSCALLFVWFLVGCEAESTPTRLAQYRLAVESILDTSASPADGRLPSYPSRAERRLEVADERVGPVDFLGTIGCRLSEVVAARNTPLGKVLVPSRRLAYELDVIEAMEECLPSLRAERATRWQRRLDQKRAQLPMHVWNAVWLDNELERWLTSGAPSWLGGADESDATWLLERAAIAIEVGDVGGLEAAFAALRDDAPFGPTLRALDRAADELGRVAALVTPLGGSGCGDRERQLEEIFHDRFEPMRMDLVRLGGQGAAGVEAIERLFVATAGNVDVPEPMRAFRGSAVGGCSDSPCPAPSARYDAAFLRHADAWSPLLQACRALPESAL